MRGKLLSEGALLGNNGLRPRDRWPPDHVFAGWHRAASLRIRACTGQAPGCTFLVLVFLAAASAQISPGPLSRPHQSLSGPTNCASCHKFGGQAALKCLECHGEIAIRINAHRGLHATYNIPPGSSQECAHCHSEHNGEDFPLIKWDVKTFDHKETRYPLLGKHAELTCSQCHEPANIGAQERATIKLKDLSKTYLGLATACATCHKDPHEGRFGQTCQQCHNFEDWKSVYVGQSGQTKFDHSKTRYPLTGEHTQVACAKCHTPGPDNKPRYTGIAFNQCSDCHKDPHHGSFPQGCQSCHSTWGWKKISLNAVNERFDHSKTKFPLEGKHASVDCAQCHAGGDFKKPIAFQQCMNCHKSDPHSGQFASRPDRGECASCHTVNAWKPSTFALKEHAATLYPLQGGHARLQCDQCHVPKGKDTQFKIKFAHCTDCHSDRHAGQFAAAPYFNACDRCHTLEGYSPSTFTIAKHRETHFVLTGSHLAVPCGDCHKESAEFNPKTAIYHWRELGCTSCHADPHHGEFKDRMQQVRADGTIAGCEACHSSKSWKELSGFDHSKTTFPLVGAHRATACMDCHKPPNMETSLLDVNFKSAPGRCEDCHDDVHGRQFSVESVTHCAGCHNSMKWKPSLFDHDRRTAFPLAGAHQNVRCGECHKLTETMEGKAVLFYKPTPKECAACHGAMNPASKSHS